MFVLVLLTSAVGSRIAQLQRSHTKTLLYDIQTVLHVPFRHLRLFSRSVSASDT